MTESTKNDNILRLVQTFANIHPNNCKTHRNNIVYSVVGVFAFPQTTN